MDTAEVVLDKIPDHALPGLYSPPGLRFARADRRSHRSWLLAYGGQWRDAVTLLGQDLDEVLSQIADLDATARSAIWFICGWLGRPHDLRRIVDTSIASYATLGDDLAVLAARISESYSLILPFLADNRAERQRYDEALEEATKRVERSLGDVPTLLNRLPLLVVSGRWNDARELWERRLEVLASGGDAVGNVSYIGTVARARGERSEAWALVRLVLPDGPATAPGSAYFDATVRLQCLAARLAIDDEEFSLARQWLEAHSLWMTWAGVEVRWGRPDGMLAWAEYFRGVGRPALALERAEQALVDASEPRQPLALLAVYRLAGELHTDAGHYDEARRHLKLSLSIAEACAAPYEHALSLVAMADLAVATNATAEARRLLSKGRVIFEMLSAQPSIERVDRIAQQIEAEPSTTTMFPAGLSPREVDVLRLVAKGWTDRQVAEHLFLSTRTVNHHLRSIYGKLGVSTRAAATGFAITHNLV